MDGALFLDLIDEVLKQVGRHPLPANGPEQKIICVKPEDRVLQILAGPGSGKTEMLVWRVLYELFVLGTKSERVMVTTFTRRAATELQVRVVERADALLAAAKSRGILIADPLVHDLRIGTIHSLCDSLLAEFDDKYAASGTEVIDETEISVRLARDYRKALGFTPPPTRRVLNRLFENEQLMSLFRAPWEDSLTWPSNMMDRVSCINALINQQVETWIPRCALTGRQNGLELGPQPRNVTADLIKLQTRWEQYLDEHQILDFAMIQKRFLERQDKIHVPLSHIFVDEFQDNNPIQFAIHTGWLAAPSARLTVVGDDDQAIYRFRGSDIECFNELKPFCANASVPYRQEKLEINYRSTKAIVRFTQEFRSKTVLGTLSMPKHVVSERRAPDGQHVCLVEGPWPEVCKFVARDLSKLGAGKVPGSSANMPPSAAILMFSTSERGGRNRMSPALVLRRALECQGVRAYNPRNKTAAASDSPVSQLLGLISYLLDPISFASAGKNGRLVMVSASDSNAIHRPYAKTQPPDFGINNSHLKFQKRFVKDDGGEIGAPSPQRRDVLDLIDRIRDNLLRANTSQKKPRLTLSGFVSRLLCLPFFRDSGFTPALFRQALFTQLLNANIAATRMAGQSLDLPPRDCQKEWQSDLA